jgi:hypothetical protein
VEGLTPALVGGVVRDAAGEPMVLARVSLTAGPAPLPDIAALTDAAGRFTITVPRPGRYQISAFTDGGSAVATVDVPAGGTQVDLRLPG